MAWEKISQKKFTYRWGGRLSTPCLDSVDFAHTQPGYDKNKHYNQKLLKLF